MTGLLRGPGIRRAVQTAGVAYTTAFALPLLLLCGWTIHIFPGWFGNPDLSHGLFTPLLFGLLIYESRTRGPDRFLKPSVLWWLTVISTLAVSALLLVVASLYASATDWSHPVVQFMVGSSMAGGLLSLWLFAASREIRLVPFNWIAGVAIGLWILSLPVPPGTYQRLTLSLQLEVTQNVLRALHLLGIPAIQNGNIIELARTSVGVEEACSGVRSLMSCIYAGFFFSAAFVRHWFSRTTLIVLSPLLAILMNFIRSLTLTLLANRAVDISGFWHDATGFAVLGVTALILGTLAFGLEKLEYQPTRPSPAAEDASVSNSTARSRSLSRKWSPRILTVTFGFAVCWVTAFGIVTRSVPTPTTRPPDMLAILPREVDGWSLKTATDLYKFSEILATRDLAQRSYLRQTDTGKVIQITFYLAYWEPGQAPVSLVATHTPDACWPGNGWTPQPLPISQVELDLPQRSLSEAEYRLFRNNYVPQHVWFWHCYDGHIIQNFDPRRPLELISSVLRYGVRSKGEQLFVRMSSNLPWDQIKDEPLVAEVFSRLQPFGI